MSRLPALLRRWAGPDPQVQATMTHLRERIAIVERQRDGAVREREAALDAAAAEASYAAQVRAHFHRRGVA